MRLSRIYEGIPMFAMESASSFSDLDVEGELLQDEWRPTHGTGLEMMTRLNKLSETTACARSRREGQEKRSCKGE